MDKKRLIASLFALAMAVLGAGAGFLVYRTFITPLFDNVSEQVSPSASKVTDEAPVSPPSERDRTVPPTPTSPKVAENETTRSQDRLFYDFRYFSTGNQIRLDFTLQENDADRKINGFTIERATLGEPTLAGPTTVSIGINGKKAGDSDWDCKTTPTQIECVGTEILQLDLQGTLTLSFGSLPQPPYKLTINLLEQGQSIANFTSLLQQ